MTSSNLNIVNLAEKMALDLSARNFLAMLSAGPEIRDVLSVVLPQMAPNEQKALVAVVAFRMMGSMMPASLEMLRRLPMFEGVKPENIGIALDYLVANGVLEVITPEGSEWSAFMWASLERVTERAVQNANTTPIVGTDGKRLF